MTIYIDPRIGSRDLADPLRERGLSVEETPLNYGDVAWAAADGSMVGLERKRMGDLLSCIVDDRFAGHQLPGLLTNYSVVFLLVEGLYRCGETGDLEVWAGGWKRPLGPKRHWPWRAVEHYLLTMEQKAGVCIRKTGSRYETIATVHALYSWFQETDHKSHLAFDRVRNQGFSFGKVPPVRRVAKEIPGIDWGRSAEVVKHFKTVQDMAGASEKDWTRIKGIGKKLAAAAYNFFRS